MVVKKHIIIILVLLLWKASLASIVNKTIYINRGLFVAVDNSTFPMIAFNASALFSTKNEVINLNVADSLIIKVINNDTTLHGFNIKYLSGLNHSIIPTDSITDTIVFNNLGVFIYYDQIQYPNHAYLGLAGMITVFSSATDKKYFWNIKEHQTQYNNALGAGASVNWQLYKPDYFTINNLSYPHLKNDTTAVVNANVGDTIHIFIVNTGIASHSLHFHGFHSKVLYSSSNNIMVNSVKETYPMQPMEGILLEMIPDKKGEYPVHDHNELALIGGGKYPNGMLLVMKIN